MPEPKSIILLYKQMSEDNSIFSDSEEEGQIEIQVIPEIEWGGESTITNVTTNPRIIAALMGLHPIYIAPPHPLGSITFPPGQIIVQSSSPIPRIGQVRRRDDDSESKLESNKIQKIDEDAKIEEPPHILLKLKSDLEFYYSTDDGKRLLLNEIIEPNRLIRNIIADMPISVAHRLKYLAGFDSDIECVEEIVDNKKIRDHYTGNLKEAILEAYIKEWRLRYSFRKLLNIWRIKKMDAQCDKEVDPITLSEPEKEVYVYDWSVKRKFVFDARSLATLIDTKLMYSEYGFPEPKIPKNPRSNVEFSYKQLLSIYNQLAHYGELRWAFTTFRQYDFVKIRWQRYHKSALTMNAIKCSIQLLDSLEARDMLSDFIFAKMDELGFKYDNYIFNSYQVAMARAPTHWYLEKLKAMAILFYEGEHFGYTNKKVNIGCTNLFKKQTEFINDLKDKKII